MLEIIFCFQVTLASDTSYEIIICDKQRMYPSVMGIIACAGEIENKKNRILHHLSLTYSSYCTCTNDVSQYQRQTCSERRVDDDRMRIGHRLYGVRMGIVHMSHADTVFRLFLCSTVQYMEYTTGTMVNYCCKF